MKWQLVRVLELSLLVLLLIACVGAFSKISPTPSSRYLPESPRELQNRFLNYLSSPNYP